MHKDWSTYVNEALPPDVSMRTVVSETRRRFYGLPDALLHRILDEKEALMQAAEEDWFSIANPWELYGKGLGGDDPEMRQGYYAYEAHQILQHEWGAIISLIEEHPVDERTLQCVRYALTMLEEFTSDVHGLTQAIAPRVGKSERFVDEWLCRKNPYYKGGRSKTRKQRWKELEASINLIAEIHAERLKTA